MHGVTSTLCWGSSPGQTHGRTDMAAAPCSQIQNLIELCCVHAVQWLSVPNTYNICSMQQVFHPAMCTNPSHRHATLLQISLVEMPSFSFNINVYGGDITFLPGVEKWINWFIETRVLRPYVLPERLTVPVKFLYDPTLEVTHCCCSAIHVLQDALWKVSVLSLSLFFVDSYHHIVLVVIMLLS